MQLTPHFRLEEFTRSSKATDLGIDNRLNPSNPEHAIIIDNLTALCVHILEPLRLAMGVPITIGSGYRCPKLNTSVGGKDNSQHLTGHAADIQIPSNKTGNQWFKWIIDNCHFHKVIWETADNTHFWIHVSYVKGDNNNIVIPYLLK